MYLLDTNIVIYCIKEKPQMVISRLKIKKQEDINISSITIAELEFGVENSKFPDRNRMALLEFLSIFTVLPFDDKDAQEYGRLKLYLKKQGNMIGPMDLLIASQAISKGMVLVTNNVKEFQRIPDLEIENWAKSSNCA